MLKDITNCPHCGESFDKVGITELQCYSRLPEDGRLTLGEGIFDETRLICGGCDGELEFRDVDQCGGVQIIG